MGLQGREGTYKGLSGFRGPDVGVWQVETPSKPHRVKGREHIMERKMTEEQAENFRLAQQALASGDIEYVAKRLIELSKAKSYERAQAVRRLRRFISDDKDS